MACLLDTGILLRLIDLRDPLHSAVRRSIDVLVAANEYFLTSTQNIAELWSVATRPASDNGLGIEPEFVRQHLELVVEPLCEILCERNDHYQAVKRLLVAHQIRGKQIHDARLVATMLSWQIPRILTLNQKHFNRFVIEGIEVLTPHSVNAKAGN